MGNAEKDTLRGNNWLIVLHPESSEEQILKALEINGQKGFADCALIFVESTQRIEKKKVAILHLKRSIRKVQVERTFFNLKVQVEKLFGTLDQIKDTLQTKRTQFRRMHMSGSSISKRHFHKAMPPTAGYSSVLAQRDLLDCLEKDAQVDVSQCTELRQTVVMVRKTIKADALESKFLFRYIDHLKDDAKQDRIRIEALEKQHQNLKTIYGAKLQAQEDRYDELKQQYELLSARYKHLEMREAEKFSEDCRKVDEWMAGSADC
jgi:hypothetical protein